MIKILGLKIRLLVKINLGNLGLSNGWKEKIDHMCQGLNSHYFHIIGDCHQPNSRGLYTHYKDSY